MIKNNLAVILAAQGITATEVSNDTGISKTTLTSLVNNTGKGVQFDTINTLCKYLRVEPKDFFLYTKYDYEIIEFESAEKYYPHHDNKTGEIIFVSEFYKLIVFFDDGVMPAQFEYELLYEHDHLSSTTDIIELYADDKDLALRSHRILKDFFDNSPPLFVTQFMNDLKHFIETGDKIWSKIDQTIPLRIFDRTIKINVSKNA